MLISNDFWNKRKTCNALLAIATDIPVLFMTAPETHISYLSSSNTRV